MKVHLRMVGCRLNQAEIDRMARQLQRLGHEIVDNPAEAEQVVINTCAVTNEATRTSRKLIREVNRANSAAAIQVTGCYAQIAPEAIEILPGVTRVVDNLGKDTIVSQMSGVTVEPFDHEPFSRDEMLPGAAGRTRAFVKVQDGCDNACTFCVTTVARGAGRSRTIQEVVHEVQDLFMNGFQEIVLTGVHLGSFGFDRNDRDGLVHLIKAILQDTDIPRIRLSSLEPWDLSADFFDLWRNPRIGKHLHLPLQSGCDTTLRRMRRNTDQMSFRRLVNAARERVDRLSITSDVITGFPGETDDEFAISKAFIEEMAFAGLHVFRYSVRPGTPAARMRGQVSTKVKKHRSAELRALSDAMAERFAHSLVGQPDEVLWEQVTGSTQDGFVNVGYTDRYIRVRCIHPRVLTNQITAVMPLSYDVQGQHLNVDVIVDQPLQYQQTNG